MVYNKVQLVALGAISAAAAFTGVSANADSQSTTAPGKIMSEKQVDAVKSQLNSGATPAQLFGFGPLGSQHDDAQPQPAVPAEGNKPAGEGNQPPQGNGSQSPQSVQVAVEPWTKGNLEISLGYVVTEGANRGGLLTNDITAGIRQYEDASGLSWGLSVNQQLNEVPTAIAGETEIDAPTNFGVFAGKSFKFGDAENPVNLYARFGANIGSTEKAGSLAALVQYQQYGADLHGRVANSEFATRSVSTVGSTTTTTNVFVDSTTYNAGGNVRAGFQFGENGNWSMGVVLGAEWMLNDTTTTTEVRVGSGSPTVTLTDMTTETVTPYLQIRGMSKNGFLGPSAATASLTFREVTNNLTGVVTERMDYNIGLQVSARVTDNIQVGVKGNFGQTEGATADTYQNKFGLGVFATTGDYSQEREPVQSIRDIERAAEPLGAAASRADLAIEKQQRYNSPAVIRGSVNYMQDKAIGPSSDPFQYVSADVEVNYRFAKAGEDKFLRSMGAKLEYANTFGGAGVPDKQLYMGTITADMKGKYFAEVGIGYEDGADGRGIIGKFGFRMLFDSASLLN